MFAHSHLVLRSRYSGSYTSSALPCTFMVCARDSFTFMGSSHEVPILMTRKDRTWTESIKGCYNMLFRRNVTDIDMEVICPYKVTLEGNVEVSSWNINDKVI